METTAAIACRCDFPSTLGGFPHSEIVGSKGIRTSPTLIAAYHVLHRLCMPRHPPVALKTLDRSHCRCPSGTNSERIPAQKDQLLEISPGARLGLPIICGRLSVSPRQTAETSGVRTNLLFTMSYRTGSKLDACRKSCLRMTFFILSTPSKRRHGGAGRDRTDDILLAKQALSQLSYGP